MPLEVEARNYAGNLYARSLREISDEHQRDRELLHQQFAKRNMVQSGAYVVGEAKLSIQMARRLANARAAALLQAYEKSGVPFDEAAMHDITGDISKMLHDEQQTIIGNMKQTIDISLGSSAPQGLLPSVTNTVQTGIADANNMIALDLRIKLDEVILEDKKLRKTYAAALGKQWDVFISHASEDKDDFVRPLSQAFEASGLRTWYDETALTVGDSLRRKIDEGLAKSRFGVVILSQHFFEKQWPQNELDGLAAREIVAGVKVILPVWHNITRAEVAARSPMLAAKLAARSSDGLTRVVQQLREAMGLT